MLTSLSPDELTLLHGMSQAATNVTTYGYEIAVKGTVITGIANLISIIITIIATYVIGCRFINWANNEYKIHDDGFVYVIAVLGIVVCLLIFGLISSCIQDSIISIFAPEYVVIKQILATTANIAT